MRTLRFLGCCAALALAFGVRADGSKTFGGKVLQVGPRPHVFVMQGGASKRFPRPTIAYDQTTRWLGVSRPEKTVRAGENVRVVAAPAKDGTFHAVSIEIQGGGRGPRAAPMGAMHR